MVSDGSGSRHRGGTSGGSSRYPLGYPKRVTLDLTVEDHDALLGARYADRVPMADRLRALISLWREDPALAEAVSLRAQELLPVPTSGRPDLPAPTEDPGSAPVS